MYKLILLWCVLLFSASANAEQVKSSEYILAQESEKAVREETKHREYSPILAGLLAEIFPGAGYYYLDDFHKGTLTTPLILPLAMPYFLTTTTFKGKSVKSNLHTFARNVFGYSVFDTYQSALTDSLSATQVVSLPNYTFKEMYFSIFDSRSYSSWKPFVPIALGGISLYVKLKDYGISKSLTKERLALSLPLLLAETMVIGMGEEAEFRGFQFPALSQITGNQYMGSGLSALSFGLCHTRWGVCSSPYLLGTLFAKLNTIDKNREYVAESSLSDGGNATDWQYLKSTALLALFFNWTVASEEHGLLQTAAAHTLYDALLTLGDLLATGNTGRLYLSLNFKL